MNEGVRKKENRRIRNIVLFSYWDPLGEGKVSLILCLNIYMNDCCKLSFMYLAECMLFMASGECYFTFPTEEFNSICFSYFLIFGEKKNA